MLSAACGSSFTILLDSNGDIRSFGNVSNSPLPTYPGIPKVLLSSVAHVSCGLFHVVCITYSGETYTLGLNIFGQLGLGDTEERKTFEKIPESFFNINLPCFTSVSCGAYHTICIDDHGSLWGFGRNDYYQLSLSDASSCCIPTELNIHNIYYIESGANHNICIDDSNKLWGFGSNLEGQLGLNDKTNYLKTQITDLHDIKMISCGYNHTVCLLNDSSVISFGENRYGQLGNGNFNSSNFTKYQISLPPIQSISCGFSHTLFIDNEGQTWATGYNNNGQLGMGNISKNIAIPTKINIPSEVCSLSSGGHHSILKDIDGILWVFGYNIYYQLGFSHNQNIIKPTQVSPEYSEFLGYKKNRAKSARK